ncbi:MAG: PAS domain-containing protein, partial [Gemmatimonadales bacterium]
MPGLTDKARPDFEQIFRSVPAACVVVFPDAPEYRIAAVNDAYLHATGKRREELIGRPLFDAFPPNPDDPAANGIVNIRHSLDTVIRTTQPHVIAAQRYDLPRPDGTFEARYWKLVSAPICGAHGDLTHISHWVEDVTAPHLLAAERGRTLSERERLATVEAKAISRAEAPDTRLHRVYQQAPIAMALVSGPRHVFEFANRRCVEMVGHRRLLGRPVREALPELDGQEVLQVLDTVFATGQPLELFERPVRLPRGARADEERFFNLVYQPLLDQDGATESIAVVANDVTELVASREEVKRAAAERDTERRRLLAVLDQSPLGITIVEAPTGRLLFANSRAGEIYGRSRPSRDLHEYVAEWGGFDRNGRQLPVDEWPLAQAITRGEPVESEGIWIEHATGHRMEIMMKSAPVRNAEGEVIAGVGVFWDGTAERRTERQ